MSTHAPTARLRPFRPVPFGRYTLLAEVAKGGMGEIYLARIDGPQGFEKLCVIKKILPQLAAQPDFVERFVNEAKTLVKLTHGSIAQVLDMGLHDGEPYLALELVDGKDLRKVAARMRDRGLPIPLTVVLHVMSRVLDALAYAHRKRDEEDRELLLVHRDISPQNILVSYEGEVKVIDFGLAKSALSHAKTNPHIVLGKFLYMSPEQARHSGAVDRRSDLYAVGLCLYELIHGQNPFDAVPPGELMARVGEPDLAPLSEVEPLCPPAVAAVVSKALQPDPAQRFQTAEEFRGRLLACLLDIDPSAGPESVSRFMREVFAADYQAERRLLASFRESTRPPTQAVLPFKDTSSARTAELVLPLPARAPGSDDVTVPRAPLQLRDVETQPRAPSPPREDTDPNVWVETLTRTPWPARADEDTQPRAESPVPDTDPRVLLGTLLPDEEQPEPAVPVAPRRRPESPAALRRPAVTTDRQLAPTIEFDPSELDLASQVTGPHAPPPGERAPRFGAWVVAPVLLLTLGAVAYFLHDMLRSGAFLAETQEAPPVVVAAPVVGAPAVGIPPAVVTAPAGTPKQVAAPATPEVKPASTTVEADEAVALEPLTPEPESALTAEWRRAREAFLALERRRSCALASMATLCARFAALEADVGRSDGRNADRLRARIRTFTAAVEARRAR